MAIVVVWTLFPIYWAAISSVKSSSDNYGNLWLPWIHFQPTLKPWRDMFALPEVRSATIISTQLAIGAATVSWSWAHWPRMESPASGSFARRMGA